MIWEDSLHFDFNKVGYNKNIPSLDKSDHGDLFTVNRSRSGHSGKSWTKDSLLALSKVQCELANNYKGLYKFEQRNVRVIFYDLGGDILTLLLEAVFNVLIE